MKSSRKPSPDFSHFQGHDTESSCAADLLVPLRNNRCHSIYGSIFYHAQRTCVCIFCAQQVKVGGTAKLTRPPWPESVNRKKPGRDS